MTVPATMVKTKVMLDFICNYIRGEPRASDETSEVIWVPLKESMDYITTPTVRFRLQNVLEFDGRVQYCTYLSKPQFQLLSQRYV